MITVRSHWTPVREMLALREAMDDLFENRVGRVPRAPRWDEEIVTRPPADAWESADHVVVELALPGAKPEAVDVRFEKDLLTISGEFEAPAEERTWILRERARGKFHREFNLRTPVDADKVEARFVNGVLVLTLPKTEAVKPRKIAVTAE